MVTNVKMEVTRELSEEIQRIVSFKNGFDFTPIKGRHSFLIIKQDMCGTNDYCATNSRLVFEHDEAEEISALDFIQSQGALKELPEFGKEYLFYDSDCNLVRGRFKAYFPGSEYPFRILDGRGYKCYKKIENISFINFLIENNCYEIFKVNIRPENQRWTEFEYFKTLDELKNCDVERWLLEAFNFKYSEEGESYWTDLSGKWACLIENKEVSWSD